MKASLILGLVASAALAVPALAQDDDKGHIYAGITGGTLGIGPELGYRINQTIGIRGNATFLSISRGISSNNIKYDGSVKLKSGGAMLDLYPFGGGFRVSGGLRINGNRATAKGAPNAGTSYTINGVTYSGTDIGTLNAETDINGVAPAVTLGYAGSLRKGLVFGVEAGALFQGGVKIKPLSITGLCAGASPPVQCTSIVADLEQERRKVQNDVDDYKVYPILQLTLGYRF